MKNMEGQKQKENINIQTSNKNTFKPTTHNIHLKNLRRDKPKWGAL